MLSPFSNTNSSVKFKPVSVYLINIRFHFNFYLIKAWLDLPNGILNLPLQLNIHYLKKKTDLM